MRLSQVLGVGGEMHPSLRGCSSSLVASARPNSCRPSLLCSSGGSFWAGVTARRLLLFALPLLTQGIVVNDMVVTQDLKASSRRRVQPKQLLELVRLVRRPRRDIDTSP
jgi:hypothetical protein